MLFILGSDRTGARLKDILKEDLMNHSYKVLDTAEIPADSFVDASIAVVREVMKSDDRFGIIIDAYGAGSFMTVSRIKGVIAAEVSDERTAFMTRSHNNTRILCIGADITGGQLAKNIVRNFAQGSYDGGRHQIRVDMLNKMGMPREDIL